MEKIRIDNFYIRQRYKAMAQTTHKGLQGHAVLIGGSQGKMGAMVLASGAAMRSGVGKVSAHIPNCGTNILQISQPEVMVQEDESKSHISRIALSFDPDALGIGPGLGTHPETVKAVDHLLNQYQKPIVFDADALNILALNPSWFERVPPNSILTPHPKEWARIAGEFQTDEERLAFAIAFSEK